jgi:hypothetical protein
VGLKVGTPVFIIPLPAGIEKTKHCSKKYLMLKKYSVLLDIIISLSLLLIANGLSRWLHVQQRSVGFNWSENFINNLFAAKAVNGAESIKDLGRC